VLACIICTADAHNIIRLRIRNDDNIIIENNLFVIYARSLAADPVRHDCCALSSASLFIGHLYLILRYIFSRTAKSTRWPIRAAHTCEIVIYNIMHIGTSMRYTLQEESIPKQTNRYDIVFVILYILLSTPSNIAIYRNGFNIQTASAIVAHSSRISYNIHYTLYTYKAHKYTHIIMYVMRLRRRPTTLSSSLHRYVDRLDGTRKKDVLIILYIILRRCRFDRSIPYNHHSIPPTDGRPTPCWL